MSVLHCFYLYDSVEEYFVGLVRGSQREVFRELADQSVNEVAKETANERAVWRTRDIC